MTATILKKNQSYAVVAGLPFSITAFARGLAVAGVLLLGLIFWLSLNAQPTHQMLAERAPGKIAVISRTPAPAIIVKNEGVESPAPTAPSASLPPAPMDGLFEEFPMGKAPIARQSDGMTPFDAYRRPFTPIAGKAPLSVTLYGMGISEKTTRAVIADFPADVTLAFDPGVSMSADLAADARAKGHETWLILPMQSDSYPDVDPGVDALLLNASLAQTKDRILKSLTRLTGYAGAVTPPDHAYREDVLKNNNIVMEQVFGRGLAVVDTRTDRPFFAEAMAKEYQFPFGKTEFWVGADMDSDAIKSVLMAAEKQAAEKGGVTLFAVATPLTVKYLKGWMQTLADKPFQLAPLSARVGIAAAQTPAAMTAAPETDGHTAEAPADSGLGHPAPVKSEEHIAPPAQAPAETTHHE